MPYKDKQKDKEHKRQYYLNNKDKIKKSSSKRYDDKKEEILFKQKDYYLKTRKLTGEGSGHGKGKKFQKGQIPWNKGKKGLQVAWNKGKKSLLNKEDHWNWKGGINPVNDTIRKSLEYRLWRKACIERDNFTCQISRQNGGDLEVHHINNFADFPELRLDINNGITMSKELHKLFHKIYGNKNNTREQLEEFLSK